MTTTTQHVAGRLAGAAVVGALFLGMPVLAVPSLVPNAAAACDKWKFGVLGLDVNQDSGITVHFESGPAFGPNSWERIDGRATWYGSGTAETDTYGIASGGIHAADIDITVNWDTGTRNVYKGKVNGDGFASGTTTDNKGVTQKWTSPGKLICITAPAPGSAQQGPPPVTKTVARDRDVYPAPNVDGDQTLLGILRAGSSVEVVGSCNPKDWCQLKGPDVPTGQGWAWGPFDSEDA